MKDTTIACLTMAALTFWASTAYAGSERYPQPCTCPAGETITMDNKALCELQAIQEGPCPPGLDYNEDTGKCMVQSGENGLCPTNTAANADKTLCIADPGEITSTCPSGSALDRTTGLCLAPCVVGNTAQLRGGSN